VKNSVSAGEQLLASPIKHGVDAWIFDEDRGVGTNSSCNVALLNRLGYCTLVQEE
jgi:hypothetical protein